MGSNGADLTRWRDHPLEFFQAAWPDARIWTKQKEIAESVVRNYGTIVPSAVEMGKDWIAGRLITWFYPTRSPCKILGTSTSYDQLKDALWGEVGRAIRSAKIPLGIKKMQTLELRRLDAKKHAYEDDWVRLRKAKDVEGMSGIHLPMIDDVPHVLVIIDECSGVSEAFCQHLEGQAHRMLVLGNPRRMAGYFAEKIREGDQLDEMDPTKYRWKIIQIDAERSPNVVAGMQWDAEGRKGPCPCPLPGVMSYMSYRAHEREWPPHKIATCLHGRLSAEGGALFRADLIRYFKEQTVDTADEPRRLFVLQCDGQERHVRPEDCWWFQACDTAQETGQENDYTVVETWAVTPPPQCLLLYRVHRARIEVPFQFKMLLQERARLPWQVMLQAVERKGSGHGILQEARLQGVALRALEPGRMDKSQRASAILMAYGNGLVYHLTGAPWLPDFEQELLEFPGGQHDDQVDCAAYAGLIFQEQCYDAATGDEELVCWPPRPGRRDLDVEDDDEVPPELRGGRQPEEQSLAELLTGRPAPRKIGAGACD